MNRIVLLAVLGIILISGCKKKPKDTPPDSAPPPATSTPNPSSGGSGGIVPAGGVGVVVNPSAAIGGGGGGGGAAMAVLKATRRAQALNELKNLGELIEGMRDPLGKMPNKEQILVELKKSAPHILKGIDEGAYILTGTMDGSGLWAYEVDADKKAGIAVIGGRALRSDPEDVKKYLGTK
jgi:hypothetical protein